MQEKGKRSETHKKNGKKKSETRHQGSKSETIESKTSVW